MSAETWTHQDVLQYLSDVMQLHSANALPRRAAKVAVRTVYRDLPSFHDWVYYRRRGQIVLSAPYSTGSIAFDYTGGANERQVTLTSGTWPTWARYGSILINSVLYKVASRVSDSIITLDALLSPGADIASGTTYSLMRSQYPLPSGFKKIETLTDAVNNFSLTYVPPGDVQVRSTMQREAGQPRIWTIRGIATDYPGQLGIEFHPAASTARTIDYLMEVAPRELSLPSEVDAGTVTSVGTAITGSGTSFPAACVGSTIRFGSDSMSPTSLWGEQPYVHESVITARASTTALTIADAPATDVSGVKYTISDPIDVNPGAMTSFFLVACEVELHRILNRDPKLLPQLLQRKDETLRLAMAADYPLKTIPTDGDPDYSLWKLGDWRADN